jgi:hypothetical protein
MPVRSTALLLSFDSPAGFAIAASLDPGKDADGYVVSVAGIKMSSNGKPSAGLQSSRGFQLGTPGALFQISQ